MVKQKTWRLIYPNGEESISNYNPIIENRKVAVNEFAERIKKGLFKLKGKAIEKDIGEYDKEVSCWDVQDLIKKELKLF